MFIYIIVIPYFPYFVKLFCDMNLALYDNAANLNVFFFIKIVSQSGSPQFALGKRTTEARPFL